MSDTQLADQFLYQCSLKSDPPLKVSQRKRTPYVIDLNQGSYSSGIITIDATSQLNGSEGFASLRDAYLMIPYKVALKNTGATGKDLAAVANRMCVGMKCGVWNIIDEMSVELNGKQIVSMGDYRSFWNNIRAQTEFSQQYVEKHGAESFLFPDDWESMLYSSSATSHGDGYINNTTTPTSNYTGATTTNSGTLSANSGFVKRLLANPPPVSYNTFAWPTLASGVASNIAQQFARGAFVAGSAATAGSMLGEWYYMLKIRLVDLHPVFKELDLMANPQIRLRLRVNQGYSLIDVKCPKSSAAPEIKLTSTTCSSGHICPVMLADATTYSPLYPVLVNSSGSDIADNQLTLAWGALMTHLDTSITGTYWPFTTARLYVPFYDLENPQAIISKPVKRVRFNDCYAQWFNQRAGINKLATQHNVAFDLQLSASIKNAKYVCLVPFAEPTGAFVSATVEQFQSPFDTAPWTCQAGSSIRNFNVRIGSTNAFDVAHDYDFNSFCTEFAKISAINGDMTAELVNGLINYQKWSNVNRVLVADVSRLTEKDVPQSIQVMGTNASTQGVNLLVIVVSEKELEYNRLTGEVTDYSS